MFVEIVSYPSCTFEQIIYL